MKKEITKSTLSITLKHLNGKEINYNFQTSSESDLELLEIIFNVDYKGRLRLLGYAQGLINQGLVRNKSFLNCIGFNDFNDPLQFL